jgi:hypothetical protein
MKRFFHTDDVRPDLADEVLSRISELYPEEDTSALEAGHVAAMVTVAAEAVAAAQAADTVAARSAAPSPAMTVVASPRRPSLLAGMAAHKWVSAAALSLSILVAFGGAAYAGVLPSPLQRATSDLAETLGVQVPRVSILDDGTRLDEKAVSGEGSDAATAGGGCSDAGAGGGAGGGAGAKTGASVNSVNTTDATAGGGTASSAASATVGIPGATSVAATSVAAAGADKGASATKRRANSSASGSAGTSAGSSAASSTASATKKKASKPKKKAKKAKKPKKPKKKTVQVAPVARDDSGDDGKHAVKRRNTKRQKSELLDSGVGGSKETSGTT